VILLALGSAGRGAVLSDGAASAPARTSTGMRWIHRKRWVQAEQGYQCCFCGGRKVLTTDHIRPRHRGGKDVRSNLRSLCPRCHHARHCIEDFVSEFSMASRLVVALEVCSGVSDCGFLRIVSGLVFRLFIRREVAGLTDVFAWRRAAEG